MNKLGTAPKKLLQLEGNKSQVKFAIACQTSNMLNYTIKHALLCHFSAAKHKF